MKFISFRVKFIIAFLLVTFIALTATTYLVYKVSIMRQESELRDRILGLAKISAMLIDVNKMVQIRPELSSQGTELYAQTRDVLREIRKTDLLIDSVYIMIKSDKEYSWIFLVDSGDKRKISAYCGEYYDVSKFPEMKLAFQQPAVDKKITRDKWGLFLSGYAPLYNSQGKAVAIIALDVKAESIEKMQLLLAKRFIFVFLVGLIFSLLIGLLMARGITKPLHVLTQGAREVGRGDLSKKVNLETNDELEELAEAFNKMTDELKASRIKLEKYYLDTIHALAGAIEAKDPYTKGHSERVAQYAVGVAEYLNFSKSDILLLQEACILHDIGKIGVPESILTKPGPLTSDEWKIMKMHPQVGADILKFIEFLRPGLSIVSGHHERQDGQGYPNGLSAEKISKLVAIVTVSDAYDAMTSDRSYRKSFGKEEAMRRLKENRHKQFDAEIVDAFILSLEDT
ncbi:MAG: HD domain-containing protein [Candidatus Omnitrophica bacterium]|nr:HD domain-containing protein [Candidatus Omnitrophota bacterium]